MKTFQYLAHPSHEIFDQIYVCYIAKNMLYTKNEYTLGTDYEFERMLFGKII